ncbi:hypothetical protein [Burkholderia gladioli]|uniref:hypothetical protein n=1 Tax=Burkholderia gladioli TaxID=28095 RepID=UPI00163F6633|nr:hypothetical protein [Burkholderia gladioli]
MSNLDERNPHYKRDPRNYVSPYTYSEYPKYVTLPDGRGVTVENELEEAAALGEIDENGDPRAPEGGAPEDTRDSGQESATAPSTTAQGTVIRKARQPGQPGRPSNAERAARAAAEAAAAASGNQGS